MIGPSVHQNVVVEGVKLQFNKSRAPYVTTKPIHSSQRTLPLEDGGMEVKLQLIPNRELESLLLSFGSDVTMLSPTTLRQKIADSHYMSLTTYSPSLANPAADTNK